MVINVTASAEKNRFLRLQPKPPVDKFLEIMKCETGFQNLSFGAKFCHRWQNQEGYNYQHIGDENVDSVRVTGLSHRVPDGYPAATS